MKKLLLSCLVLLTLASSAQKMQVQNMFNYLRNKDYVKAKEAADAAITHPQTSDEPKTWMYRGNVYMAIYTDTSKAVRDIDPEAEEKALEAYIKCLELDKGKDIYKADAKGNLVRSAGATLNKTKYYKFSKQYDKALVCFELLERSIPFDFDGGIKRANITKEKLMYERFELYQLAGDNKKAAEIADQLIAMNYKEPKLFVSMMNMSLAARDTNAALNYIEKGRVFFEDNMELLGVEIDIYKSRNKTDVLKKKLTDAIELAPDNEVLQLVLGNVYNSNGNIEEAEKAFMKALEINPDYDAANYNLGVLYYTQGKEWNDKQNKLPFNSPKFDEYDKKTKESFAKAIVFLEKYYEGNEDPNTKKIIYQLSLRLGDKERIAKYKP